MLSILRKFRVSLTKTDSVRKYLLYAIGEITLVVIGILVALQVNNWNQNMQLKSMEIKLVRAIHSELLLNESYLENYSDILDRTKMSAVSLLQLCGAQKNVMPSDSFDQLLEKMTIAFYSPIITKFEQAVNGDDLNLIANDSLKFLLSEYKNHIQYTLNNYAKLDENLKTLLDYQNKHYSRRNTINVHKTSRYRLIPEIGYSLFRFDYLNVLRDPYFENLVTERLIFINYLLIRIENFQQHLSVTLDFIERNYEMDDSH